MTDRRSPESDRTTNRRDLLRAGGLALATGLTAASAGCVATLPPLGRKVQYGRVDAPDVGEPTYRGWLPAPSAFETEHIDDDYTVSATVPGEVGLRGSDRTISMPRSMLSPWMDYYGIEYDAYDRVVRAGPAVVAEADVDRDVVRETLAPTGYEPAGEYRGYELFERPDRPRAVAVGDEAIVTAGGDAPARNARVFVDAGRGDVTPYHEVDEDFRRITGAAGDSPFVWLFSWRTAPEHSFETVYTTLSFRFDEEAAYVVEHWLLEDADGVTERDVKEALNERTRAQDAFSVDVTLEGRLATVEMRGDGSVWDFQPRSTVERNWPLVTWGLDHDPDAETVTIRHEGGGTLDAEALTVFFAEAPGDREPAQFADEYARVGPGDALTVDVGGVPDGADLRGTYQVDATTVTLLSRAL